VLNAAAALLRIHAPTELHERGEEIGKVHFLHAPRCSFALYFGSVYHVDVRNNELALVAAHGTWPDDVTFLGELDELLGLRAS